MRPCTRQQKNATIEVFENIAAMPIRQKVILEAKKATPEQKAIMDALSKLFCEADEHKYRLHQTECTDIDVKNEKQVAEALQQMIDAFLLALAP